ncbi:MAG TPA: hypothetical protein P5556_05260 [Candidatus Gastranaerophilales bacterium]|nr:hypothetical protein [Candidatus Gastranaerophilales bacterium]
MIDTLILLFGLTGLLMSIKSRIKTIINILSLQGVILFLIILFSHKASLSLSYLFLIFETLIIKALFIPSLLNKILLKNSVDRETEPYIPNFYSLVISSFILFSGITISNYYAPFSVNMTPLFFGVSFSAILTSLFFITTKKKLLTHVIGFAMLENGIFLFSLAIADEMPLIVNLGVLLDVFIAVFILGLLIGKINTVFHDTSSCTLCNLKDCGCDD